MVNVSAIDASEIAPHIDAITLLTQECVDSFKSLSARVSTLTESGVPDKIVAKVADKLDVSARLLPPLVEQAKSASILVKKKAEELSELEREGTSRIDSI